MDRVRGGGTGLLTILFVVFLVLKLTNNIAWSWWWVTAPLWIPIVLFIIILFFVTIFGKKRRRGRYG